MEDTRWDRALKVTGGGTGLVGPAGAVLLREAADQARIAVDLGGALRKAGASAVLDRGVSWCRWRRRSRWGRPACAISRCWPTWHRCWGRRTLRNAERLRLRH